MDLEEMPGIYSWYDNLIHVILWLLSPEVNWRFKQIQALYQVKDEMPWYDYWCAALSTLTDSKKRIVLIPGTMTNSYH